MGTNKRSRIFLTTLLSFLVLLTLAVQAAPAQEGNQPQSGTGFNPYPEQPLPESGSEAFIPNVPSIVSPDCNLPGNLLNNCGFETGDFTGWVTQDITSPLYALTVRGAGFNPGYGIFSSAPTEGSYAATTGFDAAAPGMIRLAQDVSLPDSSSIELTFDYRAGWDLVPYGATLDRTFSVTVEPSGGGTALYQIVILTVPANTFNLDTGDLSASVDLSAFAGQSVRVSFDWWVPEIATGPAFFQLDNVRLGGEAKFYDNFESGYTNWTMDGLWNAEAQGDACGSMQAPFPSPTHAAYYGIDGACDYDTGGINSGSLTMKTPLALPVGSNFMLSFSSYENTEKWCGGFDHRFVEISTDTGSSWDVLGELCTEDNWYQKIFDLSLYTGEDILIRFRFDTGDAVSNNHFGWLVDDVLIVKSNFPPVLDSIGNQSGDEGTLISFTATATDPDVPAQNLDYSLDPGAPAGASIHPVTGLFSWTPSEAQGPGAYPVTVRVSDDGSPVLSDFETFYITVNEVNLAPVLDPIGDKSGDELAEISFTASAYDADIPPNTLTYSLDSGAPSGASINPSSGLFSWTPTENQGPGIYPVTVRVTDNGSPNLDDFESLNITVYEVNSAPVLAPILDKIVYVQEELAFTAWATDSDIPPNTLTFSLDPGAPSGTTINPATGEFKWTPSAAQGKGIYQVTIRVTDNGIPNLSDFETVNVSVMDDAAFLPMMRRSYTQPLSCTNLIVNSGFETNSGWEIPVTTHSAAYSTAKSHDGSRSMRTGIEAATSNILSYSDARQRVTVPGDVVSATLKLWTYTSSGELSLTSTPPELKLGELLDTQEFATDFQYVTILYDNNTLREVLDNQLRNKQAWQLIQFDLSHYIGSGPIKVNFGTYNNGTGGKTLMYVDTLTLEVCK